MSDDAASPENDAGPSIPPGAVSRELPIINKRGLHARASAKFKDVCVVSITLRSGSVPILGNELKQQTASSRGVARWFRRR